MVEWLSKMLDRIFSVFFAIILLQFPLFMEQYTTRLSGHVNELNYQISQIEDIAKGSGKTLDQFIQKFISSKDTDFSKQGKLMNSMVGRRDSLSSSLTSMINANFITRPFVFLFRSDWDIVHSTASSYQLGLSFSFESAVYALVGVFIGYYIYQFLSVFFGRVSEGLKRARNKEKTSKAQ